MTPQESAKSSLTTKVRGFEYNTKGSIELFPLLKRKHKNFPLFAHAGVGPPQKTGSEICNHKSKHYMGEM